MGRFSRTMVAIGSVLVLTVLGINAALVYSSLATISRCNRLVDHSRQVILQLERSLSILKDAETGQRGYLLTGRDDYLEPFRTGAFELEPTLARLRALTSNNGPQSTLTAALARLADEKMAELRRTIALRRERGLTSALEVVASDQGKDVMDQVRRVGAELRDLEDRQLSARTAAAQAAVRDTLVTFAVTMALALLLLIAVSYFQRRETRARERSAAAVRESEAWLAMTLSSMGDGLIATDERGQVRLMNPVAQALTGWSQVEAAGKRMEDVFTIIHEPTRRPAENPVATVIREGRIVALANHTALVARDGTERPIDDSAAPIKDEAGRVTGAVLVFRDITERKQREKALRESEAWLATTLGSIGDAVLATDDQGRVKFLNPVAQTLTGWTQEEALGRVMDEVFPIINEETRQRVESPVDRVIREGIVVGLANHTVLVSRNGTETPIDDSAAPILDSLGQVAGVVLVFRDITERKQQENERERLLAAAHAARAEAEEANRAKDQFLAVLSHELRTPLNPILLATTAMLERPAEPDEVRPNLEMIRQNVNLQARLIDDLLDVMRIVRGKMPLHWEVADCHDLIHQAVEICRSEFLGKELTLTLELGAARHWINADAARLQQVFWNLIKNSVKFTPPGGTITIRTRDQINNALGGKGDRLIVAVADSGIGIEPFLLTRIFDPFQQGESSITRRFGGMGLGLAISKGIIEGHGGLITAQSDGKDRGTTFTIELQALPAATAGDDGRPSTAAPVAEPSPPVALKILLVEDEPTTMRLMARLLRALGHDVTTAGSIGAALEIESTGGFDLIVSDIGLPDGSGLELMRQIVARRGRVPAIALTGYGMEEDIQRSRDAGFTAHMTKPIDFVKLQAMIRQVAC
jgi:PAS domain S-box-containing protein